MDLFVETPSLSKFIMATTLRILLIAVGAVVVMTLAYALSEPLVSPKEGAQSPWVQLWQKALVLGLVLLGGACAWRIQQGPAAGRVMTLVFIGAWVLLAATLMMAWARSAFPIGGQEVSLLLKLGALIGVAVLAVVAMLNAWDFLGGKVLPHVLGIPMPATRIYFYDWKVLLPTIVVLASWLTGIFLAMVLGLSLLNANWLSRPFDWLFPAPVAFLAAFLLMVLVGAWGKYRAVVESRLVLQSEILLQRAAGNTGNPAARTRYVRLAEYFLGTREWNLQTFHSLADDPHSLGFAFPGFLIGVEKANRNLIGVDSLEENLGDRALEAEARRHGSRRLLGDRKRTFVSHIVEFSPPAQGGNPDCRPKDAGFGPRFHFNLYGDRNDPLACSKAGKTAWEEPLKSYQAGFQALDHLGEVLGLRARQATEAEAFTHILVLCMGWNTDQQESIRNYNSIKGYLEEAARRSDPDRRFAPLVIGISWPSQWAGFLPASYPTKADDADETGMVWGSYLLHNVLAPLKETLADSGRPVKLVLVGHSFGTRVLTRAMASDPAWIGRGRADRAQALGRRKTAVDLFVGLQGAFSIDRFVDRGPLTGGGQENAPYRELADTATRFVFTWSKEDKANPLAAYITAANHIGGTYGADLACDRPELFTMVSYQGPDHKGDDNRACPDGKGRSPRLKGTFSDTGWDPEFWSRSEGSILMVNMSQVVKYSPYGKGGKAHSDIYKYQIGHFLWKSILALENGNAGTRPVETAQAAGATP